MRDKVLKVFIRKKMKSGHKQCAQGQVDVLHTAKTVAMDSCLPLAHDTRLYLQ